MTKATIYHFPFCVITRSFPFQGQETFICQHSSVEEVPVGWLSATQKRGASSRSDRPSATSAAWNSGDSSPLGFRVLAILAAKSCKLSISRWNNHGSRRTGGCKTHWRVEVSLVWGGSRLLTPDCIYGTNSKLARLELKIIVHAARSLPAMVLRVSKPEQILSQS